MLKQPPALVLQVLANLAFQIKIVKGGVLLKGLF